MKTPSVILVPTDFSTAAEAALDTAIALAAKLGATVYVLHSYELPMIGFPDGMVIPTAEIASRIVTAADTALSECVAKRKGSGVEVVPMLRQAEPRAAILAAIKERNADLIIMGTHGRRGIARALIGSVAEALVRVSPVPVMTVHASA
jgi:nucleotide-binding universal stress UspA family protein